MGLIAAICYKNGSVDTDFIRRKAESFAVLPREEASAYTHLIWPDRNMILIAKCKGKPPTQVRYKKGDLFSLMTLGFHDLDYSRLESGKPQCGGGLCFENPARWIERSEGEFVSLLLDHRAQELHIINDRFAARPFYALSEGTTVTFSSNLLFLFHMTSYTAHPDPLGWLQIFSYGHTVGKTTNVKGIWKIRPGSHIVVNDKGLHEQQYWRLRHDPLDAADPAEYAERVFHAFRDSVVARSRIFGRGFVSLSGGLDSRLAAAAIPANSDYSLFTFINSFSEKDSPDVRTARQVAQILGREHHIRPIPPGEVSRMAEMLIRLTAGLVPIHHPAKAFQAIQQMQAGAGFKMGGGPGDSLAGAFCSSSIHNINPRFVRMQVEKFICQRRRHSWRTLRTLFRPEILQEYFPRLDASMHEAFSTLAGPASVHRTSAWAMVFRQPAFTFSGPIHNHPDVTEASPHLGYEYADLMLRLPASWIFQKNFYKFMIWHCLPALREVIYANTGLALPGKMTGYRPSFRKQMTGRVECLLPTHPMEELRRRFRKKIAKNSFEYEWLRTDDRLLEEVRAILRQIPAIGEFLDIDSCEGYFDDFKAGVLHANSLADEAELMGCLTTFLYWFRFVSLQG
ncbi:MAG: hypothetical protein JW828_13195 [Sedimentisphaerales bacterium]|nr:hypothetical protein [Sedimentisphaerales bacterium]